MGVEGRGGDSHSWQGAMVPLPILAPPLRYILAIIMNPDLIKISFFIELVQGRKNLNFNPNINSTW